VVVAYPRMHGLYGNAGRDTMAKVMDDDARLIWGVIQNPSNYLSGQEMAWPTQKSPDEQEAVVFQRIGVSLVFLRAI